MIVYFAILCLIVITFLLYKSKFKEGLTQINKNKVNMLDGSCNGNLSINISGVTTCYDVSNILYSNISLNNDQHELCSIKSTAPWSIQLYHDPNYIEEGLIIPANSMVYAPCNPKSLQSAPGFSAPISYSNVPTTPSNATTSNATSNKPIGPMPNSLMNSTPALSNIAFANAEEYN